MRTPQESIPPMSIDSIRTLLKSAPVIEHITWNTSLPVDAKDVERTFGDEIDIAYPPQDVCGVESVDTSFIINGILQENILAAGYEFLVDGDPTSFSCRDDRDQILEWGKPSWDAARYLVRAYTFQWVVLQRYLLQDRPLAEVACVGSHCEPVQKGEGYPQPYIDRVNRRYDTLATLGRRRAIFGTSTKDLVEMVSDSQYTGAKPYTRFERPVVLERGLPLGLRLVVNDEAMQKQFHRALMDDVIAFKGGRFSLGFRIYGVQLPPRMSAGECSKLAAEFFFPGYTAT